MKAYIITLSLLLGAIFGLSAQTANDYLHQGAQQYIHGKKEQAVASVQQGLQIAPNDPQLRELWQLLQKEEEQQDQNQNQDQQNDDQNQEDQQRNEDPSQQNEKKEDQQQQSAPQMSKEEIERLLKALSDQEQQLQEKISKQKAKGKKVKPEKDW